MGSDLIMKNENERKKPERYTNGLTLQRRHSDSRARSLPKSATKRRY